MWWFSTCCIQFDERTAQHVVELICLGRNRRVTLGRMGGKEVKCASLQSFDRCLGQMSFWGARTWPSEEEYLYGRCGEIAQTFCKEF